jgi:serine/threonine-protein kinase
MDPVTQPTSSHDRPAPTPSAVDLTDRVLGDYRILRQLGQGGMGQVYLAEQISLKRKVALKLLRPETANNPVALARFQNEAEAVARVTHANIVQVYQIGQVDGLVFMALEYVEGRNLREYLARKGPPDVLLALSIMRQVAGALQRAGELGLVHRDIKPENILLTRKGEVKVADFGLVRCLGEEATNVNLTQSGVTMGTPLYMSPEQVEGKALDCRSDIYSFGVTCYHMLAGQAPFTGDNAFEVAFKHVRTEAAPLEEIRPDLPAALCALVHKMMEKDPANRQQTGRELLREIIRIREGLSGTTGAVGGHNATVELVPANELRGLSDDELAVTAAPSARRRARWWPWVMAFAASLLIALTVGAVAAWKMRESRNTPTANPVPEPAAVETNTDDKTKEQSLQNLVKDIRGGHEVEYKPGMLENCLDLALLFVKQKRWVEAGQLFTQLDTQKDPHYHWLGHLGTAIVLAHNNQPRDSNKDFRDVMTFLSSTQPQPLVPKQGNKDIPLRDSVTMLWWPNADLRQAVIDACDRNRAANAEDADIRRYFNGRFVRK